MVASSVLANDGLEKCTPDLCHKTPVLNLSPLHPRYTIDFNLLMRCALAGFEPEKDELKKRKPCLVLLIFHNCSVFSTE